MSTITRSRAESLSIQQMRTFCCVYEQGGYSGAEDVLGLAGPTMWEQVKTLEKIYHTPLFQRVGRNIQPTAAGTKLYQLLLPLLANVESTFEILAEDADEAPKQIRLVTGVRMMLEELGEPFEQFRAANPDVTLRLMTADNQSSQVLVSEGKVDLALMIEPPPGAVDPSITCQRLYPIEYLAILPARHRLLRKSQLCLEDLVTQPMILGNSNTVGRQQLEQAMFRLGLQQPLSIVAETDNSAITIACVRAGLGVGVIAGREDGNLTRHVAVRSLASDLGQVYVVAAYRKGRQLTRSLTDLMNRIRAQPKSST